MRLIRSLVVTALVTSGLTVGAVAPAAADEYGCNSQNVCLYWGTSYYGGFYPHSGDLPNYNLSWIKFIGSGPGVGEQVNDNAASLRNAGWYQDVRVYENSFFRGRSLTTEPGYNRSSLGQLNNEISSHEWWS
jgi:hypothetical protein